MARKRVSDVLREEVNKPVDVEAEVVEKASEAGKDAIAPAPDTTQLALIETLKTELEQAKQREIALQNQVTQLQEKLDKQQDLIHDLNGDASKVDALKTELEQAKTTALRLAEVNATLTQELAALRAPARQPAPAPMVRADAAKRAMTPQEAMRQQQMQALSHPVFPAGPQPGQLSNQDLGWVD
jgi:peptidoglycan hydrolase CwlO-like protein